MKDVLHDYDLEKGPKDVTPFVRLCLQLEKDEKEAFDSTENKEIVEE